MKLLNDKNIEIEIIEIENMSFNTFKIQRQSFEINTISIFQNFTIIECILRLLFKIYSLSKYKKA